MCICICGCMYVCLMDLCVYGLEWWGVFFVLCVCVDWGGEGLICFSVVIGCLDFICVVGGVLWCGVGVVEVLYFDSFYGVGVCFVLTLLGFVFMFFFCFCICCWVCLIFGRVVVLQMMGCCDWFVVCVCHLCICGFFYFIYFLICFSICVVCS